MRSTALLLGALLLITALIPAGILPASNIPAYTLGGSELQLIGPENHPRVNKDSQLGLKLVPSRYKNAIKHVIGLYSPPASNSMFKPYNNYGGIFYVGSKHRNWSAEEFSKLKSMLLSPEQQQDEESLAAARAYLQEFLREGLGYDLPNRKTKKYLERLRNASVLDESPHSVVMAFRHKEAGQKDKYVVMSLAMLKGKLIGTVYYQVDPGKKERRRADGLTISWQKALIEANS